LLLKRMAAWSMGHLLSLSANHPIRALLSWQLAGDALPAHPRSIAGMRKGLKAKMQGSLMEVDCNLPNMANAMDVFAAEAQLGHRLVDCHSAAISFDMETLVEEVLMPAALALELNEGRAIMADLTLDYLERVRRWMALPQHMIERDPTTERLWSSYCKRGRTHGHSGWA